MNRPIRLRFNLSRGKNFMKWKVMNTKTKEVYYYSPDEVQFELKNCKLVNNKNSATRIKNGHAKFVCSWVEAQEIYFTDKDILENNKLSYNPKVCENWTNFEKEDLDGKEIKSIVTKNNKVYLNEL